MKLAAIYGTDRMLGGGEVSFTLTLKAVQSAGWDVLAIVPGIGPLSKYLAVNGIPFKILPLESLRRPAHLLRLISPSSEWMDLANQFKPDLIHCNAIRPALYGQALGHKFGIPTIFHARISRADPTDPFLVRRMDGIICSSQVIRNRFPIGVGSAIVRVIHNPVDLEEFRDSSKPNHLRQQWQLSESDVLIGLPGRLSPMKGQLRLIDAAPLILKQCPNARFVFIGVEDDSFKGFISKLKTVVQSKGLSDRFIFAGFQSDVAGVYQALDVIVFPTSSEGFGRIAIEAGAARKPLVANDLPVLREILGDKSDDYVVNCDDPEALAARVVKLLHDCKFKNEIANRLFEHVRRSFSMEAHHNIILSTYREVMDRHR